MIKDITSQSLEEALKNFNFSNYFDEDDDIKDATAFFNDLTHYLLGYPDIDLTTPNGKQKGTTPLIYYPNSIKNTLIPNISVITLTNLYPRIMIEDIKFNYRNYNNLISELITLRKKLKKDYFKSKDDELYKLIRYIKIYINFIYGFIDNPKSDLRSINSDAHYTIAIEAKNLKLNLVEKLLRNKKPIFYIDTDTIVTSDIDDISFDDNNLLIETYKGFYLENRKQLSFIKDMISYGPSKHLPHQQIIKENKEFFCKEYKDKFPEYCLEI